MARKIKMDWGKLTNQIKESEKKKGFQKKVDERIYVPKVGDDGNFQAIIRFLPSPDTDLPYVKKYSHGFQGVRGWYIEDCPTTIQQDCPACKVNSILWRQGQEKRVRNQSRRLSVYANILVIKDPATPENEGKVFLWRYGKTIHEKILNKITPGDNAIEDPVMVFDMEEGANFKLLIHTKKTKERSYLNYDDCAFVDATSKVGTEKFMDKVEKSLYPLKEFEDTSAYKTFDELYDRLVKVTNEDILEMRAGQTTSQSNTNSDPSEKELLESMGMGDEKKEKEEPKEEKVNIPLNEGGSEDQSEEDFFNDLQK